MFSKTKDLFNNNNSNVSIHMNVSNGDLQSEEYKEKITCPLSEKERRLVV